MVIQARYPGKCPQCGQAIRVGESINWERGMGASHVACPARRVESVCDSGDVSAKRDGFGIGELGRTPASTPMDNLEAATLMAKHLPQRDYPNGRRLDCGCVVYYRSHVMNASIGTACADCYDEMSD